MDSLLDSLIPLKTKKNKKRTTYQKTTSTDAENNEVTNLSGTGFLFDNNTIDKIKHRLNDENVDGSEENSNNKEDEIRNNAFGLQNQLISDLYDGGEDLEETMEKTQAIEKQTTTVNSDLLGIQSSTELIATRIITKSVPGTINSTNSTLEQTQIIEHAHLNATHINNTQRQTSPVMDMQQTQIIGKPNHADSVETVNSIHQTQTQIIQPIVNEPTDEIATQIIIHKPNDENEDISVTQKITGESDINIFNFTQNFNKSLFSDMVGPQKTQLINNSNNSNNNNNTSISEETTDTQVIKNDATQIIPKITERQSDSLTNLKTQKDQLSTDCESSEHYDKATDKVQEAHYDKTQADSSFLNTQSSANNDIQIDQTAADKPQNLKIHAIQKLLAEQEQEKERTRLIEYKRPIKKLVSKLKFSKDDFLADFDDSDVSEEEREEEKDNDQPANKPTSTESNILEEQFEKELDEFDRSNLSNNFNREGINDHDGDDEEHSFINKDMTNSDNKPPLHITGLINYETELKKEIHSEQYINLDEDSSDSDSGNTRLSHASKASLLNIRVRLSKKATHTKKLKQSKSTPNKLFSTLMQANQKQIQEHHKEIIESKGLDASLIEKEKDIVENLLEQEIMRNQKIRKREKEKENLEKMEDNVDFDYSDNELEASDATDDEIRINEDINNEESASEGSEANLSSNENIEEDGAIDEIGIAENKNNDDDEEEDIMRKTNNRTKTLHITDADDSEDEEEPEQTKKDNSVEDEDSVSYARNAIDLGQYGSNLDKQPTQDNKIAPLVNKTIPSDFFEDDEGEDVDEDDKDEMEARILYIDNQKKKQQERDRKIQKGKAKMKKLGISNFVEEEAEESEDEWFGVGGVDGDGADEYDSEVEKMIDDYSKANFNPDEIRQMIAQEKKDTDLKMVEKILHDLKNGGLRKRGRSTYDLELSDDEDDDLRQYRIKRREMMKQRRLDLGVDKLVQNPKSKAFFESMVEDIIDTKNPFGDTEVNNDTQSTATGGDTQEIPEKESSETPEVDIKSGAISKKFTLSEDFVHRSLSFLSETNKDVAEIENDKMLARIQHGRDVEDLSTLKKQSSIKSFKSIHSSQGIVDLDGDENETDRDQNKNSAFRNDDSDINRFRHPSILKLFGSKTDINDKFKEGSKSVKVVNSYKSVGSNKASITYLGKTRKLMPPKKRKRGFLIGSGRESKLNQLFNTHSNSFE
ncbi:hypothetical protein C6P45_001599 [Maudiozyma exigua]|uniref:DNA replication checkpoint mediator MRC1 domain-containing protein n=1 Tax=Maudiozyma exigua TaxID=34358 RepID=A0A9P6W1W9_MAUEX|nr:hypothetical protein C6P45_001599 [Kazachstania exigua]